MAGIDKCWLHIFAIMIQEHMNDLLRKLFTIYCSCSLLALCACENEGMTADDMAVPAGFALSAGTATNFLTSSFAYDGSADWVT